MSEVDAPFCAPALDVAGPADFMLPAGACDCHAHVFAGPSNLVEDRIYTPAEASFEAYRTVLDTLDLQRAVIVQPSVYGVDNRTTLNAVARGGEGFRAVVVVDEDVAVSELMDMHDQGARGARVNVVFSGDSKRDALIRLGRSLADVGWHMQMLIDVSRFHDFEGFVRDLPVPVVIDHMGHVQTSNGLRDSGFQSLLRLMSEGHAWVKLSGSYRMTTEHIPPYEDIAPFARALVEANPDQCVWASDWPHPHIPVDMPNDTALLNMLADWVPDQAMRNRILVDNPGRLYGFDAPIKK